MYALKNRVQLIGHLGNNPEVSTTATGNKMVRFRMATNETYKDAKGEPVTETQWHSLVAWGKIAEIIAGHLQKGKEVAIEGKLVNRQYEDKDGQKRYFTQVQVQELLMLSNNRQNVAV